ncbi:MAG TPA: hypothetical protein VF651_11565 [Gammaproteobacteria bacterium]
MARILMAWELGAGYGHLAPLLTLARPLRQAGHHVAFVVRDVAAAEAVLGGDGMPYYPAPANFQPRGGVLHSYAQILLSTAFNAEDELRARVRAWQSLYTVLAPDLLVADHAPTALLAARGRDLPCIVTGNGFVVPPDVAPLPDLRPWQPVDAKLLQAAEHKALAMANGVAGSLGLPKLEYLAQLFSSAAPALFTLKELDSYADSRRGAEYWGPLPGPGGAAPCWPEGSGKRIFLYGQPFPTLPELLRALSTGPHRTLAYVPGLAPQLKQLAGPYLNFADTLQDMAAVTRDCDCAVMTNGHGTTAAMLLAGKPVVVLPRHLEMMHIAHSVERAGVGLAAPALKRDGILSKIERVLGEAGFAEKARTLAAQYAGGASLKPVQNFQALVTRLAGG